MMTMNNIISISNYNKNYIGIVARDSNDNKIVRTIFDFKPYFYIPERNGPFKSIFGKNLKKIYATIPTEIPSMRDRYFETFESDVNFENRYLIDNVKTPMKRANIRKFFFDIETNMSVDWQNTPEPIISIAYYDSYDKNLICLFQRSDMKRENKDSVEYFSNEKDMLNFFISKVKSFNPDMFIGWNVKFDLGYLYNRCTMLGLDVDSISPFNTVTINKEWRNIDFAGIITFDLMTAYKKVKSSGIDSYSLQNTANRELGKSKGDVDFATDYTDNKERFIEYNKIDVQLLLDLEEKLKLIDYFDELRRIVGCTWGNLAYNSNIVDTFFLRKAKEKNIVLPKKRMVNGKGFIGAFVKKPKAGLFKNVIVCDLRRLYPSIILQYHISPELIDDLGIIEGFNGFRFKIGRASCRERV